MTTNLAKKKLRNFSKKKIHHENQSTMSAARKTTNRFESLNQKRSYVHGIDEGSVYFTNFFRDCDTFDRIETISVGFVTNSNRG